MRGVCLVLTIGLAGCTTTPKREMRQPADEELATPPAHMYAAPPDVPRDKPLLTPKGPMPPINTNPSMGGPGMGGPGALGPGSPGGMPR